jgi:hypothetical protein
MGSGWLILQWKLEDDDVWYVDADEAQVYEIATAWQI